LKEQVSLLIELQKLDLTIGRINLKKKELPEKIAKLDEEFRNSAAEVEAEKKKVDELQKHHKEKEEKLKKGIENRRKAIDRQSDVKTNKEYQAILKEIETIDNKNSEIEDEIIAALEELDKARDQLKLKEYGYVTFKVQYEHNKKKMEDELGLLDAELLTCQQKGGECSKQINEPLLKRYETIKGIRNGLAVTSVWKEVCSGCHMNIPPQMYIELQKSIELISCPNCNRIIYWRDQDKNDG
jgi:predicted  nucleic acid-binding Zn-ribbon protein